MKILDRAAGIARAHEMARGYDFAGGDRKRRGEVYLTSRPKIISTSSERSLPLSPFFRRFLPFPLMQPHVITLCGMKRTAKFFWSWSITLRRRWRGVNVEVRFFDRRYSVVCSCDLRCLELRILPLVIRNGSGTAYMCCAAEPWNPRFSRIWTSNSFWKTYLYSTVFLLLTPMTVFLFCRVQCRVESKDAWAALQIASA